MRKSRANLNRPGIHVSVVDHTASGMADIKRNLHARVGIGLSMAAKALLKDAQYYVPIETGALTKSGKVIYKRLSTRINATVSYKTPYVGTVHENLFYRHGLDYNIHYQDEIRLGTKKWKRPQEQAKFLQKPGIENRQKYIDIALERVRKLFK